MATDTKAELMTILKEHKALKEGTMKSLKESGDVQAPASSGVSGKGTPLDAKSASQDDHARKYAENDADKDVQAAASGPQGKGTPLDADTVAQDDTQKAMQPATKMEADHTEPDADNAGGPSDKDEDNYSERFKEFEGDMGKMVEILEAMKNSMSGMEERIKKLEGAGAAEPTEAPMAPEKGEAEMPVPPMTESKRLSNSFAAIVNTDRDTDKAFKEAVKKTLAY